MRGDPADILNTQILAELLEETKGALHIFLGVRKFHPRLQAPEKIGRDGQVTLGGEAVGHRAYGFGDSENFLQHDNDVAVGLGRFAYIGAEFRTISRIDVFGSDVHDFLSGLIFKAGNCR